MNILGISAHYHDSAAALLVDGLPVAAVQEERLSRRKGSQQFTVIGISTDDYPEAAKGFLRKFPTSFSHFIDRQLLLENMLGADRLPLTLLVDKQGRVLGKYYGAAEWDGPQALKIIRTAFALQL